MTNSVFIEKEIIRYYDDFCVGQCDQCKRRTLDDFCISTSEKGVSCLFCGYDYSRYLVIDQERTSLDPYNRDFVKLDDKGHAVYDIQKKKGFGAYEIHRKKGVEFHQFHEPINRKDIDNFRNMIAAPDVDRNDSYLTRWNDEKNRVELVVGYCPELVDDLPVDPQNQQDIREDLPF